MPDLGLALRIFLASFLILYGVLDGRGEPQ